MKIAYEFQFYDEDYFHNRKEARLTIYLTGHGGHESLMLGEDHEIKYSEIIQNIKKSAEDQSENLDLDI